MVEIFNNNAFSIKSLAPVLIFCLPIYFLGKLLEKKLQPRKSFVSFIGWAGALILISVLYFYVVIFLYTSFFIHQ